MRMLDEFAIKGLTLKNRVVLPPMDTYSAGEDGRATPFHLVHYGSRALGGAGLIILEATAITPKGRITDRCLGLWEEEQIPGLREIADFLTSQGTVPGIQLNHAGRKSQAKGAPILAPSPLAFSEEYRVPAEMTLEEIREAVGQFGEAARRAREAGFRFLEVHGAHGYLISTFLSPLTNKREDAYGGSRENRSRFLREVLLEVRKHWPEELPLGLRVSASDYLEGGMTPEEMTEILLGVRELLDVVHVSSGGVALAPIRPYPGYQVGFAQTIREGTGLPVIAVGLITTWQMAEEILMNSRADLVALGRELFRNPNFTLQVQMEKDLPYTGPEAWYEAFSRKNKR